MLTVGQECCPVTEIDVGRLSEIRAATFTVNGEYIVGGGPGNGLGVWRVQDGKQMAMLAAKDVHCVAVSQDGKRIAAGTDSGEVFVWNAEAFEQVFFFARRISTARSLGSIITCINQSCYVPGDKCSLVQKIGERKMNCM